VHHGHPVGVVEKNGNSSEKSRNVAITVRAAWLTLAIARS
jgi:hypothetical protein